MKYKDIVLTDIPCSPSSPQKYARKLLDEVYTKEEMASGLFNKIGFSTKEVLSPTRKTLIWSKCYLYQRGDRCVCMCACTQVHAYTHVSILLYVKWE